jgi:hypothetical protein
MHASRRAVALVWTIVVLAACSTLARPAVSGAADNFGATYTISFGPDGRVRALIECGPGMRPWNSREVWLTPAMCTPGSVRDLVFLALVADVGAYEFRPVVGSAPAASKAVVASKGPFKYECREPGGDNDTLIATFYETEPSMVLVERGGHARPAFRVPAASGSKYEGRPDFMFWDARGEALVNWSGSEFKCKRR